MKIKVVKLYPLDRESNHFTKIQSGKIIGGRCLLNLSSAVGSVVLSLKQGNNSQELRSQKQSVEVKAERTCVLGR